MKNTLRYYLFFLLICSCFTAWADDTLMEHHGDHYTINVGTMEPDNEMTLMDVLQLCPELTLMNGMTLNENYILCVDDVALYLDNETFLRMVKAREVETIDIYMNPSVSQGAGGSEAVINIYYKKADKKSTTGKVVTESSTYGNALIYADVNTQQKKLNIRGYALGDLYYVKGTPSEGGLFRERQGLQLTHVSADWDISSVDNLKIKLFQQFTDYKERYYNADESYNIPAIKRTGNMAVVYTRTINDKEGVLQTEAGASYVNENELGLSSRNVTPYFVLELNTPFFVDDLWITAGWEIGYENSWQEEMGRQQFLSNDFYLQLDYNRGPWILTLGSRHSLLNYWDHFQDGELSKRWSHRRNATSFLASAGYKWGRHCVQGSFNRDFYVPSFDDFYEGIPEKREYNPNYHTNMVWRTDLRYTLQQHNIAFLGILTHSWKTDLPTPRENLTGIRTSMTWHKGALRLTAGANYYHKRFSASEEEAARCENFYTLKLAPTLLLGNGFRLSASMLYKSKQKLESTHPHLFASIKVNKDLGRHCNIYADFHDLTGFPTFSIYDDSEKFHNRALTLGFTYRF